MTVLLSGQVMRRFVPLLMCLGLSLGGLCTFSCFAQAAAHKDPHACCHGTSQGSHHSAASVRADLPAKSYVSEPALPASAVAFSLPVPFRLQTVRRIAPSAYRSLPP